MSKTRQSNLPDFSGLTHWVDHVQTCFEEDLLFTWMQIIFSNEGTLVNSFSDTLVLFFFRFYFDWSPQTFGFNSCNRNNSQISPGQSWWTEFPSTTLRDCWVCCSGECQLLRTPYELIPTNYQSWKTNKDKVLVWPVESALIQDLQ